MKRLDKFSLLIENEEMGKEVKRIADKAGINNANYNFILNAKYDSVSNSTYYLRTDGNSFVHNKEDFPLITFDQFKAMFEPKIIGYKCPMDCYKSEIKKGCLYGHYPHNLNVYVPLDKTGLTWDVAYYSVPKEIAMSWEPIYEEVNTELDNLKNEAEKLKTQLDSVMKAIDELDKK